MKDSGYKWKERVIVFRSLNMATTQIEGLEKRLKKAEAKIAALNSPKKGKKPKDLQKLKKAVDTILKTHDVEGLIRVSWKKVKTVKEYQRTEIRRGRKRNGIYCIETFYYELASVLREAEAIQKLDRLSGWRIYVTNMHSQKLSMEHAVIFYRDGWKIERLFHFLKSHPIGIQPLYVKGDDQLRGLFRLLTIALRLWTHMEMQVHKAMEDMNICVKGIYKGQPQKKTKTPSGELIVKTFENLSIMRYNTGEWFITTLGELSELFLELLDMKYLFQNMLEWIKKINLYNL
jgi:transposase